MLENTLKPRRDSGIREQAKSVVWGGVFPHKKKVEEHAESIYVTSCIGLSVSELLGRCVRTRSKMSRVTLRTFSINARDPEVDDGEAVLRDENVRWFKVAMDDGCIEARVQFVDGITDERKPPSGELHGSPFAVDLSKQRVAFDEFHDDYDRVFSPMNVVDVREVNETSALLLGESKLYVGLPKLSTMYLFPDKRSKLSRVLSNKIHELSRLERRGLECLFDAKTIITCDRGKIVCKLVPFHISYGNKGTV